jgi:hypothetical protein
MAENVKGLPGLNGSLSAEPRCLHTALTCQSPVFLAKADEPRPRWPQEFGEVLSNHDRRVMNALSRPSMP